MHALGGGAERRGGGDADEPARRRPAAVGGIDRNAPRGAPTGRDRSSRKNRFERARRAAVPRGRASAAEIVSISRALRRQRPGPARRARTRREVQGVRAAHAARAPDARAPAVRPRIPTRALGAGAADRRTAFFSTRDARAFSLFPSRRGSDNDSRRRGVHLSPRAQKVADCGKVTTSPPRAPLAADAPPRPPPRAQVGRVGRHGRLARGRVVPRALAPGRGERAAAAPRRGPRENRSASADRRALADQGWVCGSRDHELPPGHGGRRDRGGHGARPDVHARAVRGVRAGAAARAMAARGSPARRSRGARARPGPPRPQIPEPRASRVRSRFFALSKSRRLFKSVGPRLPRRATTRRAPRTRDRSTDPRVLRANFPPSSIRACACPSLRARAPARPPGAIAIKVSIASRWTPRWSRTTRSR